MSHEMHKQSIDLYGLAEIVGRLGEIYRCSLSGDQELHILVSELDKLTEALIYQGVPNASWLDVAVKTAVFHEYSNRRKDNKRSKLNSEISSVYVLRMRGSSYYKIGVSTDVEKRVRQLSKNSPRPLDIVFVVQGGTVLESSIHREFLSRRTAGEWFELDAEDMSRLAVMMGVLAGHVS